VDARGYEDAGGFVVAEGSQVAETVTPSMKQHSRGVFDLREDLIKRGVIDDSVQPFCFTQNYSFGSPSTAATLVLGRSSNGRTEWKNASGRSLKAIQQAVVDTV
jgi:hypothetical protein